MDDMPASYDAWKTANREDYLAMEEHEVHVRDAPLAALLRVVADYADPGHWPHHPTYRQAAQRFRAVAECGIRDLLVDFGHRYLFLEDDEWEALHPPNEPDGL